MKADGNCFFRAVSDSAAYSLSKHKVCLDLGSLTELSDSAAESLSKHKGDLELCSLTALSDSAAKSLSKHKGWLNHRVQDNPYVY